MGDLSESNLLDHSNNNVVNHLRCPHQSELGTVEFLLRQFIVKEKMLDALREAVVECYKYMPKSEITRIAGNLMSEMRKIKEMQ